MLARSLKLVTRITFRNYLKINKLNKYNFGIRFNSNINKTTYSEDDAGNYKNKDATMGDTMKQGIQNDSTYRIPVQQGTQHPVPRETNKQKSQQSQYDSHDHPSKVNQNEQDNKSIENIDKTQNQNQSNDKKSSMDESSQHSSQSDLDTMDDEPHYSIVDHHQDIFYEKSKQKLMDLKESTENFFQNFEENLRDYEKKLDKDMDMEDQSFNEHKYNDTNSHKHA